MPTPRPRHQDAETDEVARSPERKASEHSDERRRLVAGHAGGFSFEPGHLEELRQDWAE